MYNVHPALSLLEGRETGYRIDTVSCSVKRRTTVKSLDQITPSTNFKKERIWNDQQDQPELLKNL